MIALLSIDWKGKKQWKQEGEEAILRVHVKDRKDWMETVAL